MTEIEIAKRNRHIIEAALEGKQIQYRGNDWFPWQDYPIEQFPGVWTASSQWRIKPEPSLRPWTAAEFPLHAAFRHGNDGLPTNWIDVFHAGVMLGIRGQTATYTSWEELAKNWQYTVDGGKSWHRCGVEE